MNYIYCYTNKINGHCYVGQTNDVERRQREHRSCSFNEVSNSYNDLFHKKFREYGESVFKFEILEEISEGQDATNKAEIRWIEIKKSFCGDGYGGYNMDRGGKNHVFFIYEDVADSIKAEIKKGTKYNIISEKYGISPGHISNINHGKYYYDENEIYPLSKYYKEESEIEYIRNLLINTSIKMTEIAKQEQMAYSTIKKINSGALHKKDNLSYPLRKVNAPQQRADRIKEMLLEGKDNISIIQEVGCSAITIKRINIGETFYDDSLTYPLR